MRTTRASVYRAVQIQATRRSKNRPPRRSLAQNVCHSNIIQDRALEFFGLAIIGARRLHSVAAEWPEFGPPSTLAFELSGTSWLVALHAPDADKVERHRLPAD